MSESAAKSPESDPIAVRQSVTRVLARIGDGAPGAKAQLVGLLYGELKRMAARKMRGQAPEHTLQPTALVHEAYLRLVSGGQRWHDRNHFLAAAARAMRSILVDHARRRRALKRGGGERPVTLNEEVEGTEELSSQIVEVHEALERLAAEDPRKNRVVELLFFGGLTVEETAEILEISTRTVKRDWRYARAWLYHEIGGH